MEINSKLIENESSSDGSSVLRMSYVKFMFAPLVILNVRHVVTRHFFALTAEVLMCEVCICAPVKEYAGVMLPTDLLLHKRERI